MGRKHAVVLVIAALGIATLGTSIAQVGGPPKAGDPPSGVIGQVPGPKNPPLGTAQQQLDAARAQAQGAASSAMPGPGTQFGTGVESGAQIGGRTGTACMGPNGRAPICKPR